MTNTGTKILSLLLSLSCAPAFAESSLARGVSGRSSSSITSGSTAITGGLDQSLCFDDGGNANCHDGPLWDKMNQTLSIAPGGIIGSSGIITSTGTLTPGGFGLYVEQNSSGNTSESQYGFGWFLDPGYTGDGRVIAGFFDLTASSTGTALHLGLVNDPLGNIGFEGIGVVYPAGPGNGYGTYSFGQAKGGTAIGAYTKAQSGFLGSYTDGTAIGLLVNSFGSTNPTNFRSVGAYITLGDADVISGVNSDGVIVLTNGSLTSAPIILGYNGSTPMFSVDSDGLVDGKGGFRVDSATGVDCPSGIAAETAIVVKGIVVHC